MRLVVPELLKVILVDDWEAVTKNSQVICCLLFILLMVICSAVGVLATLTYRCAIVGRI